MTTTGGTTEHASGHDPYRRLPGILFDLMRAETSAHVRERIEQSLHLLLRYETFRLVEVPAAELRDRLLRPGPPDDRAALREAAERLAADHAGIQVRGGGDAVVEPLAAHGVLLGALVVHRFGGRRFTHAELGALADFAALAALALHSAHVRTELNRLAYTDVLTGLGNRRRLVDAVVQELERGGPLSIAFADLDGLHDANEALGYEGGDRLILALADAVRSVLDDRCVAARFGGDEFVVMLAGHDAAEAAEFERRLVAAVDAVALPSVLAAVWKGASVAVVTATAQDDADSLLQRGGRTMLKRKVSRRSGRRR